MREFPNAAQETWEHDTDSSWSGFLLTHYGCGDPRCCPPKYPYCPVRWGTPPMDDSPPTDIELLEEAMTRG